MEFEGKEYPEVTITPIYESRIMNKILPQLGTLIPLYEDSRCVRNAYITAKRIKATNIEGFVTFKGKQNGKIIYGVVRHCWNKYNTIYFDVTHDFIWKTKNIAQNITDIDYHYFILKENQLSEYPIKNEIEIENLDWFLSNAMKIAQKLNDELTELMVNTNN